MPQSWIMALIGGGLIGLSATIHLLVSGRIAGVSGIFSGLLSPKKNDVFWRVQFVVGLILGGFIASQFVENPFLNESGRSLGAILIAGFLVGFGTKLGNGCTSGHGVCGISRLSPRSLVATLAFIAAGMVLVRFVSIFA